MISLDLLDKPGLRCQVEGYGVHLDGDLIGLLLFGRPEATRYHRGTLYREAGFALSGSTLARCRRGASPCRA